MESATHKDKRKNDGHLYRLNRNTEYQEFENYGICVEFFDKYSNRWLPSMVSKSDLIEIT